MSAPETFGIGGRVATYSGAQPAAAAASGGPAITTNQSGGANLGVGNQIGSIGNITANTTNTTTNIYNQHGPVKPGAIYLLKESGPSTYELASELAPGDRVHLQFEINTAGLLTRLPFSGPATAQIRLYNPETKAPYAEAELTPLWHGPLLPDQVQRQGDKPQPIDIPQELPGGTAQLCLVLLEQAHGGVMVDVGGFVGYVQPEPLTLRGTYTPAEPLKLEIMVDFGQSLPDAAACLHIYQGPGETVNLRCYQGGGSRHEEREVKLEPPPSCELLDEAAARSLISGARAFTNPRAALLDLLKKSRDVVMVCDYAGTGVPWEAIMLGPGSFLGAVSPTSRWMRLEPPRPFSLAADQRAGPVLALGALPGAPPGWPITQVETAEKLWDKFFAAPQPFSLVYVADGPEAAKICEKLEERLWFNPPAEGPRPLFVLGAPDAARVQYQGRAATGVSATLLREVADGVLGLEGRGDPATTERLIGAVLGHLAAGLPIGEALRLARLKTVENHKTDGLLALATALLLRYYGNPLLKLAAAPAGDTGGGQ